MPDMEKVISWLEGLAEPDWRECYSDSEVQETARQALDLIDELLKEQEEVKPQLSISGMWYECPICHRHLTKDRDNYCARCGRRLKWE